jgi:hypothetical protein
MTSLLLLELLLLSQLVVFTDGTTLEVAKYEVRGELVVLTTTDGKLQSVPRSYLDVPATRAAAIRATPASGAVTASSDREHLVTEAVELVGLRRLSSEISRSAEEVAEEYHSSSEHDATSALMASAIASGFAEDDFFGVAERAFRERATTPRLQEAVRWLRSPFARQMERIESEPDGETLVDYARQLETEPPTKTRLELLERLDVASGTSETAVEMQAAMMTALLKGVNHGAPAERRLTAMAIERVVREARPRFAQRTRDRVQLSLMFTYRHVTDNELRDYLEYLESENGLWMSHVVLKSLFVAMEEAARRSGEVIAEGLAELRKTKV